MCDDLPGRPGTPEYRSAWLERRHEQMVQRIAEMNHEKNVAVARAERLERALQHIACRDEGPTVAPGRCELVPRGWARDMVRAAKNALADAERYDVAASDPAFGVVSDGFGSEWPRCSAACQLEVVRPGKAQCDCDS